MNEKFDKKEILKQIETNRIGARKLVEKSIKDAKKILEERKLLGYESSPLAVVKLAEALFRVEAQTLQAKSRVEQAEVAIKAQKEATEKAKEKVPSQDKTPVA